jgi:polar amino acid transport system permease protein
MRRGFWRNHASASNSGIVFPGAGGTERSRLLAWRIAFFGALTLLAYLSFFRPDPYREILEFVPDGIFITLQVTVESIILALVIGLFAGLGMVSGRRWLNLPASLYVEVIRGIPLLVQLFYLYYALTFIHIPDILTAVLAMSICYGAYMGEIVRAGIQSIPRGQMEAARSLGLTHTQTMIHVILPQAFRTILPPVGNEFVALLKDSSLVSILAVADLLRRGREYASETFTYFETYTVIALVYLIITLFFSKMVSLMENRINARR